MMEVIGIILYSLTIAALMVMAVLVIECVAALFSRLISRKYAPKGPRPSIAIIVPAHNEETVIAETLQSLKPHLTQTDRLIVIADNCNDRTTDIAQNCGAEIFERIDPNLKGKGYALNFALDKLEADPPQVVIIVDADCVVETGSLDTLAFKAFESNRPVQATYLMKPPSSASARDVISTLAFCIKNLVRPLGLSKLKLPCLLTGSGMAFPIEALRQVPPQCESIVEDMQWAVDLTLAGFSPTLCEEVVLRSVLPLNHKAATSQRTRWVHGHLNCAITNVPRLLNHAIRNGSIGAFGLAAELCVPPLSLLVAMIFAIGVVTTTFAAVSGVWLQMLLLTSGALVTFASLVACWITFARKEIRFRSLIIAPVYFLWNLKVALAYLWKPQLDWVKTRRDAETRQKETSRQCNPVCAKLPTIDLRGVRIHSITEQCTIDTVTQSIKAGNGGCIITVNLQHLHRCEDDSNYRRIVKEADLVVADGKPLCWAGSLQGTPLPERIAGSDLVSTLSEAAAMNNQSIFMLGGDPGTAEQAANTLRSQYPNLNVAGTFVPEFGFEKDPNQLQQIKQHLIDAAPDIVYVALGSPKQEYLIEQLREYLPSTWWIGVGISFSFLSGDVKRAPLWMQQNGLEWLHRLVQEPRRLAKRYLVEGLPFAARMLMSSTVRGMGITAMPRQAP